MPKSLTLTLRHQTLEAGTLSSTVNTATHCRLQQKNTADAKFLQLSTQQAKKCLQKPRKHSWFFSCEHLIFNNSGGLF
jgi:hypothetical protein